jgi:hypothetical protein
MSVHLTPVVAAAAVAAAAVASRLSAVASDSDDAPVFSSVEGGYISSRRQRAVTPPPPAAAAAAGGGGGGGVLLAQVPRARACVCVYVFVCLFVCVCACVRVLLLLLLRFRCGMRAPCVTGRPHTQGHSTALSIGFTSVAGAHLAAASFRGLEVAVPEDAPGCIVEGAHGVAAGYEPLASDGGGAGGADTRRT